MKRVASLKRRSLTISVAIITLISMQPAAATELLTTLTSSCSATYGLNATWKALQPFSTPAAANITAINIKMANSSDPSRLDIRIYADNAGAPSNTSLGAFTYSSTSVDVGRFTGNVTLSTAGKYWIYISATAQAYGCFTYSAVTTGSLSNWTLSRVYEGGVSVTPTVRGDDGTFLFSLEGTGGVPATNSSISLSTVSRNTTYRTNTTVTATLGVAGSDGKVTFYANEKKIPGCIDKASSGLSASCTFKPSTRGSLSLKARLAPSNSAYLPSTSAPLNMTVSNRTGSR